LLDDALYFTISISLKLRIKPENAPSFQTLMEQDFSVVLELICLASNIKKYICIVLDYFSFILEKISKIKSP
jgi:hypothetical protein